MALPGETVQRVYRENTAENFLLLLKNVGAGAKKVKRYLRIKLTAYGARESVKQSKQSTDSSFKMKAGKKPKSEALASFKFIQLQKPNKESPAQKKESKEYKILKRVAPEIRTVPLPKHNSASLTYATSSKAKQNRTRKPRREFEDNKEHLQWLIKAAIPECQELLKTSEELTKELKHDKDAARSCPHLTR